MGTFPKPREHLWVFLLVIAASIGAFLWWLAREQVHARDLVAREEGAFALLNEIAAAQSELRAQTGGYGWIEDLLAAGLLAQAPRRTIDGETVFYAPGYRLDVLLPVALTPEQHVRMQLASEGRASAKLREQYFAVVARPLDPSRSGYRTYYLDETGTVYWNEGVVDPEGLARNPLPRLHLSQGAPLLVAGIHWVQRPPERAGDDADATRR